MRSFYPLSLVLCIVLFSCSPSQAQQSNNHDQPRARHRHIHNLYSGVDAKGKRDQNAAFTYFSDGQGACGATNGPNDFIVALNSGQYDGGAHCFEMITITIDGKTAQAQITDECPGCSFGGLDFSKGLFEYFAPTSEGELYGSWSYNSEVATSSSTPSSASSTPTPTTTTTTTTSSSSTVQSTTTMPSSASTAAPSAVSTATSTPGPQTVLEMNLALLELGGLLQASLKLSD